MGALVHSIRGTLAGVLDASQHLAWYVDWSTGNRRCARASRAQVADPLEQLVDAR